MGIERFSHGFFTLLFKIFDRQKVALKPLRNSINAENRFLETWECSLMTALIYKIGLGWVPRALKGYATVISVFLYSVLSSCRLID